MDKTMMAPMEVKRQMLSLNWKLERSLQQKEKIERRYEVIKREIKDLQEQCPHKNVHQKEVLDVMEYKTRTYCRDCGLEARDFKTNH